MKGKREKITDFILDVTNLFNKLYESVGDGELGIYLSVSTDASTDNVFIGNGAAIASGMVSFLEDIDKKIKKKDKDVEKTLLHDVIDIYTARSVENNLLNSNEDISDVLKKMKEIIDKETKK